MDKPRALALVLRITAGAFIVVFTLLFLASCGTGSSSTSPSQRTSHTPR